MALIDNILAYWKLDDNYNDEGGSSLTLTANASPTFATGIINNGSDLELSSSQYLSRATSSLYPSLPFSVNMWVKFESTPNGQTLIAKGASTGGQFRYRMFVRTGGIRAGVHNSSASHRTVDSSSSVTTGVWIMLTLVADGTDLRLYWNGTEEGTPSALTTLNNTAEQPLHLGSISFAESGFLDGVVDEVGIWDKGLTSSEVTELYNSGSGLTYPFSAGTNMQINIGDAWKIVDGMQINIGDAWKAVAGAQVNIGDSWKSIY